MLSKLVEEILIENLVKESGESETYIKEYLELQYLESDINEIKEIAEMKIESIEEKIDYQKGLLLAIKICESREVSDDVILSLTEITEEDLERIKKEIKEERSKLSTDEKQSNSQDDQN